MTNQTFKYEVSFSFLKQDESIAFDLNDKIQDRLTTFIYSRKQEELGGTDGEKTFNNVFNKESRIVVVLYRNGWGKTPWTRIEETAIKNRAFESDWNFLLVINLDDNSTLPSWIPLSYIWLDYQRFKAQGAVAIIEHKVNERGGHSRPESIQDVAERMKRQRYSELERKNFLMSEEASRVADDEMCLIVSKLKELKPILEDPETRFLLSFSERNYSPLMYEFGYFNYFLCFNNLDSFVIGIQHARLRVTLYLRSGHHGINYSEEIIKQVDLCFDRDLLGNNGWSEYKTGKNFTTTEMLIDKWVKSFVEGIGKRKANGF